MAARDTQRSRVYRAESVLASSPLPGLDACAGYIDRVVGTLWWNARFPQRHGVAPPRLRPGNGARQAFYREEASGPTITLPRRYRTKGVVLHELAHWAVGIGSDLPPHGHTFTRVLLDLTGEFRGPDHAGALASSFDDHGVHVGEAPRAGPDGHLRYGCDERLRLGAGTFVTVAYDRDDPSEMTARFEGFERRRSVLRFALPDGPVRIPARDVWDVRRTG